MNPTRTKSLYYFLLPFCFTGRGVFINYFRYFRFTVTIAPDRSSLKMKDWFGSQFESFLHLSREGVAVVQFMATGGVVGQLPGAGKVP